MMFITPESAEVKLISSTHVPLDVAERLFTLEDPRTVKPRGAVVGQTSGGSLRFTS